MTLTNEISQWWSPKLQDAIMETAHEHPFWPKEAIIELALTRLVQRSTLAEPDPALFNDFKSGKTAVVHKA